VLVDKGTDKHFHTMPTTPQAVTFVLSELWSPAETEFFLCHYWPPAVTPGHLRALLSSPPFSDTPYMDHLVDIGLCLVLVGHQRSLVQILQGIRALPLLDPLPPIQVCFLYIF
jgi:hypothetical protein